MTFIIILLLVLCVESFLSTSVLIALWWRFKRASTTPAEIEKTAQSEEKQLTEEQARAEQMMLDGINNILAYDLDAAMGGEDK